MKFYKTALKKDRISILKAEVKFLAEYGGEVSNWVIAREMYNPLEKNLEDIDKLPKKVYLDKTLKEVLVLEYQEMLAKNNKELKEDELSNAITGDIKDKEDTKNKEDLYKVKDYLVVMEVETSGKGKSNLLGNLLGIGESINDYKIIVDMPKVF